MDIFFLFLLLLMNFILIFAHFRIVNNKNIWSEIITVPVLFYLFNYPLRAVMLLWLGSNNIYYFDIDEINFALFYSTLFMLLLLVVYHRNNYLIKINPQYLVDPKIDPIFCNVLFIFIIAGYGYKWYSGRVYSLGEEGSAKAQTFLESLLFTTLSLQYGAFAVLVVFAKKKKTILSILKASLMFLLVAVDGYIRTAKGPIAILVLVYLFVINHNGEIPKKKYIVIFAILCFFYFNYTYMARSFGVASGIFETDDVQITFENVKKAMNENKYYETGVQNTMDRFCYLDAMMLVFRNRGQTKDPMYILGSATDALNVIPRILWPNRPVISFDLHNTNAVYGNLSYCFMPIGRIAESFYVLSYAGLLYAVFYGYLFAKTAILFKIRDSLISKAYLVTILFLYVWQDDNLLNNIVVIIADIIILYLLYLLSYYISTRYKELSFA